MNTNELQWITASRLGMNPFQTSLLEKLENFGWCADFSGFGEEKAEKAMLCVLDVIGKKEKPNILIICPERFTQSWYCAALFRLGLEFKLASGVKNAIYFFSPKLSNLFIVSEDILADDEAAVLKDMRESKMVWDLMIIDASGNTNGADASLYTEHVGMKAEQLLLFAPYPSSYDTAPDKTGDIIKALSNKGVSELPAFDQGLMSFTMDNACLVYPSGNTDLRDVKLVEYSVDPKRIPKSLHIEEMQGGGRYTHGGNIFEEYNLEERKTYLRPVYTRTEAEILKNTDAKLKAFLDTIEPIMNSDDQAAVVYFCSDTTMEYVEKILNAVYFEKKSSIAIVDRSTSVIRRLKQWYEEVPEQKLRIVLTKDEMDETIAVFDPITHIINYELPDDPAVLQQRFVRKGLSGADEPEFIIFSDNAGLFDGRVLKKALVGNLYKAFRPKLPCENILFRIDGIEQIFTDMLIDIKYVADYTGAVGSSFDIISRFKDDYNIPPERNLTTAARTHEYSKHKLEVLSAALGVSSLISAKETDKEALLAAVTEKVEEMKGSCAYFDENGTLSAVPIDTVRNSEFKKFSGFLSGNPYYVGLEKAENKLKSMADGAGGYAYIKNDISELPDILRTPVLYHVWLYWHKELGHGGSYAEFIKAYNDGSL